MPREDSGEGSAGRSARGPAAFALGRKPVGRGQAGRSESAAGGVWKGLRSGEAAADIEEFLTAHPAHGRGIEIAQFRE